MMLSHEEVAERHQDLEVNFYDFRLMDSTMGVNHFPKNRMSHRIVFHERCVLVKLSHNGLICGREYVLSADGSDSRILIDEVCRRVKYAHSQSKKNIKNQFQTPFVITVIDTALDLEVSKTQSREDQIEESLGPLLNDLKTSLNVFEFQKLRIFKDRIAECNNLIESFSKALEKSIDEDLSLTSNAFLDDDLKDEFRLLIHTYQIKCAGLKDQCDQILEAMTESENSYGMRIDSQRNQILKFELLVITFTFATSIISAVSGLMGMNLDNSVFMPEKTNSFVFVTVFTSFVSLCVFIACVIFFRRVGVI